MDMTPQEKAKELFERFENATYNYFTNTGDGVEVVMLSKQSALIAVDEIIKSRNDDGGFDDTLSSTSSEYYTPHPMYLTYWVKVKQEIEKL